MMLANMADVLAIEILDNRLWQWLALLGVLLGSMIAGRIISYGLLGRANRLRERPGWETLEILLRAIEKPAILLLVGIGLHLSRIFMTLDAEMKGHWTKATTVLVTVAFGWLVYRLVDAVEHYLRRWTSKTETPLDDQLVPLIRKSLRVLIVIMVGLFIVQNVCKQDIGALLAGLGLGGLAFALAAKDTLANLFGSLTILADRPFHLDDRIRVNGHDGVVEEVGFRSTRLRTLDGNLVIVPNASMTSHMVENVGRRPFIKRVLNVTVTYDTPPEKLQRGVDILKDMLAARMNAFPEENPPRVSFSDFNAESLNIVVYYYFTPPDWWEYLEFNHAFNSELLQRFNDEGIEFAFPTRTLYVKQDSPIEANVRIEADKA
ncbi:MAG: mechanosensitive ion channel family protein [Planctomycetota bacterium]|jgi:MscS family membrane protein